MATTVSNQPKPWIIGGFFLWLKSIIQIPQKLTKIMANQEQLIADLKVVNGQLVKIRGEISSVQDTVTSLKAKIAELEAVIAAGGEISQELTDLVAEAKSLAQLADDQIPDLPVPPPAEPTV